MIGNYIKAAATGTPTDQDAQAFFTASGLSDTTQKSAINRLVIDLKDYGIWSKMKAIYPFIGGTAALHKWNLKDPRDLDAAYRLTFFGGWTHSSAGAKPNGTNGYADTFLNNNVMAQTNISFGAYSGENNPLNGLAQCLIGTYISSIGCAIYTGGGTSNSNAGIYVNGSSSNTANPGGNTNTKGLYFATKTSTESYYSIRGNDVSISYPTTNHLAASFKIGRLGNFNGEYSNQVLSFSFIGDGLTLLEIKAIYISIQKYNTTLLRQF